VLHWHKQQFPGSLSSALEEKTMCEICVGKKNWPPHDVRLDRAGLAQLERLTCRKYGCNNASLVRQPFMSNADWDRKVKKFLAKHPCTEIVDEGSRG